MRFFACLLALFLVVRTGRAEDDSALVLSVRATRVDRAQLGRALDEELRGPTNEGSSAAPGHLTLSEDNGGVVRLTYRDALGNTSTRELTIAEDDPDLLEKVTLAAANLVRDQSAELLAALGGSTAQPDLETPPPVRLVEPDVAPALAAYNACRDGPALVVGGDLLPSVGTSSTRAGRESARYLSLNLGGSYSAGVRGFELSMGFNIARRGACGVQHAVGLNLSLGEVRGLQFAIANAALGEVRGVQLGLGNFTREWATVQLGLGNVALRGTSNLQLGVGNVSGGSVRGLQIGLGNFARYDATVQVGMVNISRRAKAPIGLVSIVRDGRTTLDTWVSENGSLLSGVSHGGEYVHNHYAVGFRFGPSGMRVGYSFGIGARLFGSGRVTVDLDTFMERWSKTDYVDWISMVIRLRLTIAVRLTDSLAVFAAPGYAIMITDDPDERTQATLGGTVKGRDVDPNTGNPGYVYGFNSLSLGLRVYFGAQR